MKLRQNLAVLLLICLGLNLGFAKETVTLEDGSQVELKGIGLAQELRNDIYIGALYAPAGYESMDLIQESTTPKRISVRYIADNYSYRNVSRHFKERIAMNSAREVWQPLTREIVTFSRLFNQNIVAGDEIILDFIPGKGTLIYLNGLLFETFENPQFFNLFLNAWIGSVPPTKAFKEGILGQLSDSEESGLLNRFAGLSPIKGRFKLEAASTDGNTTQVAEAKAEPPAKNPQPKPEPKKEEPKKVVAKAEPKPEPKKEPPKKVVEKPTPKPEPQKEIAETTKPVKAEPKQEPPKVQEDFIDEDLIRGSYVRDLIAEVRKNQEYPRKALLNGEQGDGLAQVTIDRAGELLDVTLSERTGSRELDKAIIKMVRKTAPFPPIPSELKDSQFMFDIPVVFQL